MSLNQYIQYFIQLSIGLFWLLSGCESTDPPALGINELSLPDLRDQAVNLSEESRRESEGGLGLSQDEGGIQRTLDAAVSVNLNLDLSATTNEDDLGPLVITQDLGSQNLRDQDTPIPSLDFENDIDFFPSSDSNLPQEWQPDLTNYCQEVEAFDPVFGNEIQRWLDQDQARSVPSPHQVMLVGSSSVRRWEAFTRLFHTYQPIQRGVGGAQLGEIAYFIPQLLAHHPNLEALIVFAGTNDLNLNLPIEIVMNRLRCLRSRVGQTLNWTLPILWLGVTPTPARWEQRQAVNRFNETVAAYAQDDPYFYYLDAPQVFLAQRSLQEQQQDQPPPQNLYDPDQLHLSEQGYQIWHTLIQTSLDQILPSPSPPTLSSTLPPNTKIRIDLGSQDNVHGEGTPSPDYLGFSWNNWPSIQGEKALLPGEHMDQLIDINGQITSVSITNTGGCKMLGWQNGGIRWPSQIDYGELAVGSATGDLCTVEGTDLTGGFLLSGLNPEDRLTLRIVSGIPFGVNQALDVDVYGGATTDLVSQGTLNSSTAVILELTQLQANPWGELYLDLKQNGTAAMGVSLIEIQKGF